MSRLTSFVITTLCALSLLVGHAVASPATSSLRLHLIQPGETLSGIAKAECGNAFRYPEIANDPANEISDPHWIYPNRIIEIPCTESKANENASRTAAHPVSAEVQPVSPAEPVREEEIPAIQSVTIPVGNDVIVLLISIAAATPELVAPAAAPVPTATPTSQPQPQEKPPKRNSSGSYYAVTVPQITDQSLIPPGQYAGLFVDNPQKDTDEDLVRWQQKPIPVVTSFAPDGALVVTTAQALPHPPSPDAKLSLFVSGKRITVPAAEAIKVAKPTLSSKLVRFAKWQYGFLKMKFPERITRKVMLYHGLLAVGRAFHNGGVEGVGELALSSATHQIIKKREQAIMKKVAAASQTKLVAQQQQTK